MGTRKTCKSSFRRSRALESAFIERFTLRPGVYPCLSLAIKFYPWTRAMFISIVKRIESEFLRLILNVGYLGLAALQLYQRDLSLTLSKFQQLALSGKLSLD